MTELSITVPPGLQRWMELRLAGGRYADAGDYVRDLIRRDQDGGFDETEWLRAMIEEGRQSGVVEGDARDILRQIMEEHPAPRG